jgi:precorrin-3B synthase
MPSAKAGIIPRLTTTCLFPLPIGDHLNPPAPAASSPSIVRPSACPGLLRVVRARDGGLCRVKLPGGVLMADQADVVALAAERFGSGVIEATNRGNLQIRGLGAEATGFAEGLLAAGLGPRVAAADDVRNLMLSPAAGIDPQQLFDTRELAARILDSLEDRPRLHQLSAKFAVQLDGGEGLAMLAHHHDVWLSPLRQEGQLWLAVGLAGSPADGSRLAVAPEDGHAVVMALLEGFLDRATAEQGRMREVLAAHGLDSEHGLRALLQGRGIALREVLFERPVALAEPLGLHAQAQPGRVYVGAGAPLGRLDPAMLRDAAELARRFGDGSLRFTPWQGLLLPGIAAVDGSAVAAGLAAAGWLVDPAQPLAQLLACTGSAGCAKGLADTKADALRLSGLLTTARPVHLSGCPRSCAAAHVAPVTLLAVGEGRYDLYLRDATQQGFGTLRARHLSLDAAAVLLGRSRSDTDD